MNRLLAKGIKARAKEEFNKTSEEVKRLINKVTDKKEELITREPAPVQVMVPHDCPAGLEGLCGVRYTSGTLRNGMLRHERGEYPVRELHVLDQHGEGLLNFTEVTYHRNGGGCMGWWCCCDSGRNRRYRLKVRDGKKNGGKGKGKEEKRGRESYSDVPLIASVSRPCGVSTPWCCMPCLPFPVLCCCLNKMHVHAQPPCDGSNSGTISNKAQLERVGSISQECSCRVPIFNIKDPHGKHLYRITGPPGSLDTACCEACAVRVPASIPFEDDLGDDGGNGAEYGMCGSVLSCGGMCTCCTDCCTCCECLGMPVDKPLFVTSPDSDRTKGKIQRDNVIFPEDIHPKEKLLLTSAYAMMTYMFWPVPPTDGLSREELLQDIKTTTAKLFA
eukprot:Nk52_evm12s358 gene=Nk52_evmTU12s358